MKSKVLWFIGGFSVGMTLLSLGHAALPNRVTPETADSQKQQPSSGSALSEIKSDKKVAGPDLEDDYARLTNEEAQYAESWSQQEKIRNATTRATRANRPLVKKKTNQ